MKALVLCLGVLFCGAVFAAPVVPRTTAQSQAQAQASNQASSASQTGPSTAQQSSTVSNTLNFPSAPATTNTNVHYSGTTQIDTPPAIYAPGLTNSMTETCLGSASGGLAAPGFGVTFGKTMTDEGCERRLDASIMARLNMPEVSFRIMCEQKDVYSASQGTSHPCPNPPEIKVAEEQHPAPIMNSKDIMDPQYTDPYIRQRLGLPPLPKSMEAPQ